MNNQNNPNVFVLDSLLEHPDDWKFDKDPTYKFITHKSGFCLNFHYPLPEVFDPEWAKLYKFSDEDGRLVTKAILSLQKERNDAAKTKLGSKIAKMFEPNLFSEPLIGVWPQVRFKLSNMLAHPLFWALLLIGSSILGFILLTIR